MENGMNQGARILVLGGYGHFGKRVCELLSKETHLEILIGGRRLAKAEELANKIKNQDPKANVIPYEIDWEAPHFEQKLKESRAFIVIHTASPFFTQDYTVPKACIALKMHYIDSADTREFVVNIGQLDEQAKNNEVIVVSGATSVPGLSSVVIDTYAKKFSILREIDFGIASHQGEKGKATYISRLVHAGKPFLRLEKGQWKTVYAWQNVHQHYYGDNLGMRWHANFDIPDLALLPERYPMLETAVFHAGLESALSHFLMWQMSWLKRAKIVPNLTLLSKPFFAINKWLEQRGQDVGGMYVHMRGSNINYQPLDLNWILVAEKGHGQYIPVAPSIILVKKIMKGELDVGARPCLAMFSLTEFEEVISSWSIYTTLVEKEM